MTASSAPTIEAAGGVLWRRTATGRLQVAVVHRPRYDEWSLPKGKVGHGEPVVAAAVREVAEETGREAVIGRPLGEVRYAALGRRKRVRYWALAAGRGKFKPSREVDHLEWLSPTAALIRLDPDRDQAILRTFLDGPPETCPLLVVRHASAGSRADWNGADADRPLDIEGQRRARQLCVVLEAYGVQRLVSADVHRCLQTLRPYARHRRLEIETQPVFSEEGYARDPGASSRSLMELAAKQCPTAVCSQGQTIPGMMRATLRLLGSDASPTKLGKGDYCVLHLCSGDRMWLADLELSTMATCSSPHDE